MSATVEEGSEEQLTAAVWRVVDAASVPPPHAVINIATDAMSSCVSVDGDSEALPSLFVSIAYLHDYDSVEKLESRGRALRSSGSLVALLRYAQRMKLSGSFSRAGRGAVINIAVRPMAVLASMVDL